MLFRSEPGIAPRVLEVRVRRAASNARSGWLEFSVADVGCGLTEEIARQLFTPFFTTRPEGMGLGLSLCRTVVEQHGGFLGFAPHQPRGTVFTFTLPAVVPEPGMPSASIGTIEPVCAALSAVSGAARPRMSPWPNLPLAPARRFSVM